LTETVAQELLEERGKLFRRVKELAVRKSALTDAEVAALLSAEDSGEQGASNGATPPRPVRDASAQTSDVAIVNSQGSLQQERRTAEAACQVASPSSSLLPSRDAVASVAATGGALPVGLQAAAGAAPPVWLQVATASPQGARVTGPRGEDVAAAPGVDARGPSAEEVAAVRAAAAEARAELGALGENVPEAVGALLPRLHWGAVDAAGSVAATQAAVLDNIHRQITALLESRGTLRAQLRAAHAALAQAGIQVPAPAGEGFGPVVAALTQEHVLETPPAQATRSDRAPHSDITAVPLVGLARTDHTASEQLDASHLQAAPMQTEVAGSGVQGKTLLKPPEGNGGPAALRVVEGLEVAEQVVAVSANDSRDSMAREFAADIVRKDWNVDEEGHVRAGAVAQLHVQGSGPTTRAAPPGDRVGVGSGSNGADQTGASGRLDPVPGMSQSAHTTPYKPQMHPPGIVARSAPQTPADDGKVRSSRGWLGGLFGRRTPPVPVHLNILTAA
jgi:hypothetical protein